MNKGRNGKSIRLFKLISARDLAELLNKANRFLRDNNAYLINYQVFESGTNKCTITLLYEIDIDDDNQ